MPGKLLERGAGASDVAPMVLGRAGVTSQPASSYEPTTVPLTGAGWSVQRSLMVDANSLNAGSVASGL